jgi:hypothetical protein
MLESNMKSTKIVLETTVVTALTRDMVASVAMETAPPTDLTPTTAAEVEGELVSTFIFLHAN